jgi:cytochrome c5
MKKSIISILFATLCVSPLASAAADKPVDLKVGEEMYGQLCVLCHASGVDGAPRLGVKEDWQARLPMGEDTLYKAVIEGPNHMYSKGNSPVESEGQIRSMIAYMMASVTDDDTRKLVDTASEEDKARHLRLVRGYKLYDLVCFNCHDTGEANAPRIGKPEDWSARKELGVDGLTSSVVNGKGHMFMRAGTANHSEADYKTMVEYMLSTLAGK